MSDNDSMQLRLVEPCVSLMKQGLQASTRGPTALAHVSKTLRHVLHLCTNNAAHLSLEKTVTVQGRIARLDVKAASQYQPKLRPHCTHINETPNWHTGAVCPPG